MADWYVSSVAYAAVPQWAATTAYSVGQFVRSVGTPTGFYQYYVHRCTTAGTTAASEPSWNQFGNNTTTSGTAIFTNVTGQSAYGWSAAAGTLCTFTSTGVQSKTIGDRIFIASNHSESSATSSYLFAGGGWGGVQVISVNPAGSVPPVAADEQSGAAITSSYGAAVTFDAVSMMYWQGVTITVSAGNLQFNGAGNKTSYFKNCSFVLSNTSSSARITTNNPAKIIWDNVTVSFGHIDQSIAAQFYIFDFTWINTTSAIVGATIPTTLFTTSTTLSVTCKGVDLSAVTGSLMGLTNGRFQCLLDNCRVAPAMTRYIVPNASLPSADVVELVNCFDGTNQLNERYNSAGALTTDRNTTMSGGASDGVGNFSFKMVSNANSDKVVGPLSSFIFDVENTVTGLAKTATVEIISSATLNNDDVKLSLQYLDVAGSTLADVIYSSTPLTTVAALSTSSVTWNNPPGTPVKQYLRVTFTPRTVGRVRGQVHLGKPSTTIWVNPQMILS